MLDRLIIISNSDVSMTYKQYKAYSKGEVSLADIKFINSFDKAIPKLLNDPIMERCIVISVAYSMYYITSPIKVAAAEGLEAVDSVGFKILSIAQKVCYWVCLTMGIKDIIQELMKNDILHNPGDIVRVIIKYSLAFASVYVMPELFDLIKASF